MLVMANHRGIEEAKRRAIGARLHSAWQESRYRDDTLTEAGKRFGVSYQSFKNWVDGEKLPGVENLLALSKLYNISLDWLLLGRGAMRPDSIRGEAVYIGDWPEDAQSVVKGMASVYGAIQEKPRERK
jgi:hypothetical protein